jgi:hypothetical protein
LTKGLGCNLVVENMPSLQQALSSTPSPGKRRGRKGNLRDMGKAYVQRWSEMFTIARE